MNSLHSIHSSTEVLETITNAINPKYIQSLFVAGSQPTHLQKQQDIDIFAITKKKYTQHILETLDSTCTQTLNATATHSFVDGPIKYQNKGLVHLLVWNDNPQDPESLYNVPGPVLYTLKNNHDVLLGKTLDTLLPTKKLLTKTNLEDSIKSMQKKKEQVTKQYSRPKQWIRTQTGWEYKRKQIRVSEFRKEYLLEYYTKHISEAKTLLRNEV